MYWRGIMAVGALIAAVIGAIYLARFWNDIREKVADWLREHNLEKSVLMDAWVKLDQIAGAIRCLIFVKTGQPEPVMISETTYAPDEIDDVDVVAELEKRGYYERNIMEYLT